MTMDDAEELRKEWTSAFPEVKLHFNPEQASNKKAVRFGYGMDAEDEDEDDEIQEDTGDKRLFVAHLINGMTRNNGSYCSILNIQFQGLAAYGLKLGLWNMAMAGFLPRMLNEVHDEANYWLMPDELKTYIPVAEDCMIRGMRVACPDVKVKVESTCMLHWDKNAVEFNKLEWDDQGRPIIEEPPFVQEVYGIKSSSEQE